MSPDNFDDFVVPTGDYKPTDDNAPVWEVEQTAPAVISYTKAMQSLTQD